MPDKTSFVLYAEYMEHIELLSREQRGDLLTAIFAYASETDLPEMDGVTKMAFSFIKAQLDRDKEKYKQTVEKRREAGKLGGRPKANGSEAKAKKANGFSEKQTKAKKPDNDNVDVYVDDNDKKDIVEQGTTEYQYKDVIDYLNQKTGKAFKDKSKDTRSHIKARFDEGYSLDDFKKVIDNKVAEWGHEPRKGERDMRPYLRPCTLFGSSKNFENYLNQGLCTARNRVLEGKFRSFEERDYDMDKLTRELLNN